MAKCSFLQSPQRYHADTVAPASHKSSLVLVLRMRNPVLECARSYASKKASYERYCNARLKTTSFQLASPYRNSHKPCKPGLCARLRAFYILAGLGYSMQHFQHICVHTSAHQIGRYAPNITCQKSATSVSHPAPATPYRAAIRGVRCHMCAPDGEQDNAWCHASSHWAHYGQIDTYGLRLGHLRACKFTHIAQVTTKIAPCLS